MRITIAVVMLALVAVACGTDGAEIAPTTTMAEDMNDDMSDGMSDGMGDMSDGMGDMSDVMGDMNMGDPDAVAAADVPGAEVVSGSFRLLPAAPPGFDSLTGSADLARHDGGTTVTIEFDNLLPNRPYIAHVHAGSCFDSGGPHYQFEVGGSEMPPNEIHLAFTSHSDGSGFMTAENHQVAGPDATSVVVHESGTNSPKIACADLS